MSLRQQFNRTRCDCQQCVACCTHMPGSLIPGDLELILKHQKGDVTPEVATEWLLENFQASEGATAMIATPQSGPQLIKIPTIVPRLTETGCIFLKEGKCTIHAVSPFGCSFTDVHKGMEEADKISRAMGIAQMEDHRDGGSYAQAWKVLADAGKMAPPLKERRGNLDAAIARIERAGRSRQLQPNLASRNQLFQPF